MASYVTISEANTYFAERLHTDAWDEAPTTDKTKALAMATRHIDRLDFTNSKTDDDNALEFPRGDQTAVPRDIEDACCEIALDLLDGKDPDEMLEEASIVKESFGAVHASYDRSGVPEHILSRIVSATAWTYLQPYLKTPGNIRIDRVS